MSDLALSNAETAPAARATPPYRPASYADIAQVHARLGEVIAASPYYNDEFKAYETARLTRLHLATLIDADPHHVMVFERDGKMAAFILSTPQLGTLWLDWLYVFPEHRRSPLGLGGMRAFINHWDNGRFHNIATYTRPRNAPVTAILGRLGYRKVGILGQHAFGEDYLLFERNLTKVKPGYDSGLNWGLRHRLMRQVRLAMTR